MPCCGLNFILIGERLTELRYYLAGLRPCVVEVTRETKVRCWLPPNLRRAVKHDESLPLVTNGASNGGMSETSRAGAESAAELGSPSTDMGRVKCRPRMPLLLLHGFGASAIWQWSKQVHGLTRVNILIFRYSFPTTCLIVERRQHSVAGCGVLIYVVHTQTITGQNPWLLSFHPAHSDSLHLHQTLASSVAEV